MNWIFTACVACKNPVQTRKKIQLIKLEISNWRMSKIGCRYIGGEVCLTFLRLAADLADLSKNFCSQNLKIQPRTSFDLNDLKNGIIIFKMIDY